MIWIIGIVVLVLVYLGYKKATVPRSGEIKNVYDRRNDLT